MFFWKQVGYDNIGANSAQTIQVAQLWQRDHASSGVVQCTTRWTDYFQTSDIKHVDLSS